MAFSPAVTKKLNRNASTIIICGIFLFFSGVLYMTLCDNMKSDLTVSHDLSHHRVPRDQRNSPGLLGGKGQFHNPTHVAFLVILIVTAPRNQDRRQTIRETWLSQLPHDVAVYFTIGTNDLSPEDRSYLKYEDSQHKDLLLLPSVKDSYNSLTLKLLQSLVWLDEHVSFKFLLKVDDDSFARLDVIRRELKGKTAERMYWGFFNGRANVKYTGKWAEPGWFLCDFYLPYARGGGYILSYDIIHYIAANAKYFKLYKNEDTSLGAWLAPLNIIRIHDPRFDTEFKSRGCHNSYIVTHKQSVADMRRKHKTLKDSGKLCDKVFRTHTSYIYNWNAPPSQCCVRNDSTVP